MKYDEDLVITNINEFTPDIKTLNENIHMGPQANVLELIEDFNNRYIGSNFNRYNPTTDTKQLGITKKFYWKPGAYNTIRDIIHTHNELSKKSNSLSNYIERARNNAPYRMRTLLNDIRAIETELFIFRRRGLIMQDNSDDIIEAWEFIKNHLIAQQENGDFIIEAYETNDPNTGELTDYHIVVRYSYFNPTMKFHMDDDAIADIEIPGEYHMMIKMPLSKLLNIIIMANFDIKKIKSSHMVNQRFNSNRWAYRLCAQYDSFDGIDHPYISRSLNGWAGTVYDQGDRYVCSGSMEDDVKACVTSLDFISLKIFIDRIMTYYDTYTSPLNNIRQSYHGRPSFLENMNELYYNIVGKRNISACGYRHIVKDDPDVNWVKNESYCANYCTAKERCETYIDKTKELTPDEVAQMALEQATIAAATRRR